MGLETSIGNEEPAVPPVRSGSRGFLGKIGSRIGAQTPVVSGNIKATDALLLLQNFEQTGKGWFWSTDAAGNLTYISEFIAELFGSKSKDLLGKPFASLFLKPVSNDAGSRSLSFMFTKKMQFSGFEVETDGSAEARWLSISGRPHVDKSGNFQGFYGSGNDITEQRKASEDSSRLATFDSLTGLPNRASMVKKLESTLAAFRIQKRTCAVMLVDLDRFKQINDTLGHPAGDALLKQVAERLLKIVEEKGEVYRLGGDEFQVMLPDCDDRGILGELARKIIDSLSQPYSVDGRRCIIGASIGVSVAPFDGLSSDDIVKSADLALYEAKGNGRGRFRFYSKDLQQSAEDRRVLEEDLRDAVAKDELALAYQPIVNTKTNVVEGFEALMRWNHPERGQIPPALFIPIAEEANLIAQLSEWALHKACADAAKWPGKTRVAVNVSAIQFADQEFPTIVDKALRTSGLSPERLELELTEGVFLAESNETSAMFDALKRRQVRLVLDDFGTGYSSLSYLQTAPFDKIKIDQSFVRGATEPGSRNGAIIAAIVALADALGMETTAEGIETLDEFELISELKVSHVQGHVYSSAVNNEMLVENLEGESWTIEPSGPRHHRNERLSMYRKVRMIHENHVYSIVVRNLSVTGALVEGLYNVPVGTKFVIDFGDGQLAVATVCRSSGNQQGIEFEARLVSDGNGGLCTSRRVSPYLIAEAGLEVPNMPAGYVPTTKIDRDSLSVPAFSTVADWTATRTKPK
jgi:diguanylate cyclase (GGDEF)-like protein/PAS domain S-box-containing protein